MLTTMQAAPLSNIAEFTVSELSSAIKRTVEDAFGLVRLRGEISGYRGPHSSGHAYLCLKDDSARIDAVIWRTAFAKLKFKPEEGLEVIVTGRITTFPGKSSYQIVIEQLEPAGAGALMALLEERKKKFAAEGLFDPERKRALPFWPQVVGIVTSPTGAVIRDMLHGFTERCPTRVLLWPVRVQGETCGAEVAAAIRGFNALSGLGPLPRPDLLIVARGGGSLEDLWGFNEEAVVRAVAESTIPLDFGRGPRNRLDLDRPRGGCARADADESGGMGGAEAFRSRSAAVRMYRPRPAMRAAASRKASRGIPQRRTRPCRALMRFWPCRASASTRRMLASASRFAISASARAPASNITSVRLTPRHIRQAIERAADRLSRAGDGAQRCFRESIVKKRERLADRGMRLNPRLLAGPAIRQRERLELLAARAAQGAQNALKRKAFELTSLSQLLRSLSHKSVLDRGFAIVRGAGAEVIRRAAALKVNAALDIEFADGHVSAHYLGPEAEAGEPALRRRNAAQAPRRTVPANKDDGSQGNLL